MWFKNLQVYRLPAPWAFGADTLEASLRQQAFMPASSNELLRMGWAAPREDGQLVHVVNRQMLLCLRSEKKLLPASVISQVTKARADELEEQQGFRPGKKATKELRERVADELLPRAFSVVANTLVWIDPVNGWLVVDAASPARADDAIKLLLKAVDRMPLESLRVARSPVAVMTGWLQANEAPHGFTIDRDTELQASGESKAKVKYVKHTLEHADIARHIAAGKQCTRLAMTWNDRVSFVLTEALAVKSVKALDVLRESEAATNNDAERFDSDFALMAGELAKLLADLVDALGGEAHDLVSRAQEDAGERQPKRERAVKLTAELYEQRRRMREVMGSTYTPTINAVIPKVKAAMAAEGVGAIEAALGLAKNTSSTAGMTLICAAMEIIEPSDGAHAAAKKLHDSLREDGATMTVTVPGKQPVHMGEGPDPLYDQAVAIVRENQRASISLVQRHLYIGYNRAARLLEAMELAGMVSPMQPNGNRNVLLTERQGHEARG